MKVTIPKASAGKNDKEQFHAFWATLIYVSSLLLYFFVFYLHLPRCFIIQQTPGLLAFFTMTHIKRFSTFAFFFPLTFSFHPSTLAHFWVFINSCFQIMIEVRGLSIEGVMLKVDNKVQVFSTGKREVGCVGVMQTRRINGLGLLSINFSLERCLKARWGVCQKSKRTPCAM